MRKYWGKIILAMLLIFVVGYGFVSAGRKVKETIVSGQSITIPLGSFVPFKLDNLKVGSIRSIKIRRKDQHTITGFEVRVRLSDTAAFTRLTDCNLSVTDADNFDERTSFLCLPSDSGYQAFGEVIIALNDPNNDRTLGKTLLLSDAAVAGFQRHGRDADERSLADSIAAEVNDRVRPMSRAYRDSIRADELERQGDRYKARAESLRARSAQPIKPPAATPANPAKPL